MLNAYDLQKAMKPEKEVEGPPKISFLPGSEPPQLSLISDTRSTSGNERETTDIKLEIEKKKTIKEILNISCHEIRNFLFGISGMISLLTKNNILYEEMLKTTEEKAMDANFKAEILKIVAYMKSQINELKILTSKQTEIVGDILNTTHFEVVPIVSTIEPIDAKSAREKAVQILKVKLAISDIVNELKKTNTKLEALLSTKQGLEVGTNLKKR